MQLLARRILPSLCPLLWDVEPTVRDSAFDVVQSLLNRIYAGHQEWTKSGVEPKAPLNPPKQPTSVIGVTGSYVSSAINWVSGSLLNKSETPAPEPAGDKNEPPKAISSSNVNRVLPPSANVELSLEELEALGKPSQKESLQRTESQKDEDMWGDSTAGSVPTTSDWGSGWAEEAEETEEPETKKDPLTSMGGWDDTNLTFSDDNEEEKKEDANLEMIRRMAKKEEPVTVKDSASTKPGLSLRGKVC